ncbi:hypothetical protein DPMN_061657 [Dreissena polymorpha]|uniref:Uncharacterized protein n=1 Tax=Dreissena polymorpha TaxID=45954 RepID=A0A9D4HIM4_DREPO|nr:hypothetical protein DPMN_061657 [Dreissena polymorpha]
MKYSIAPLGLFKSRDRSQHGVQQEKVKDHGEHNTSAGAPVKDGKLKEMARFKYMYIGALLSKNGTRTAEEK